MAVVDTSHGAYALYGGVVLLARLCTHTNGVAQCLSAYAGVAEFSKGGAGIVHGNR